MKDSLERILASIRASQTLRLLAVGFLALLILIPIAMISGLVSERQQRRQTAVAEVSSSWGNAQSIAGPVLVVPYAHRWTESAANGVPITRTETRHVIFLPTALRIRGAMDAEIRSRGIFSVPVYRLALTVEGEFARPQLAELGIDPASADWRRAHVAVGISDARAIQESTTLTWGEQRIAFLPGTGGFTDGATTMSTAVDRIGRDAIVAPSSGGGIHAVVAQPDMTQPVRFSFPLTLNGSQRVDVAPFGQTTVVEIQGDHGHPSFRGAWLPTERTVEADSFRANWSVSFLGRGYPQAWTSETPMQGAIDGSRFGVELVDPVDHYRMAERSVKYAGLFILLTFALVWLIEVLSGVRVHPIQYLMLGGALCLFYLLELSLSEHLGFPLAYAMASFAVIGMVAAYGVIALKRVSRALVVAGSVAALYAYLYFLLMNEDYALLIGSIGLFAMLGAIMYATRRVDWYSVGSRPLESSLPRG